MIAPRQTRPRLIAALEALASKRETLPAKKHGNIPGVGAAQERRVARELVSYQLVSGQLKDKGKIPPAPL